MKINGIQKQVLEKANQEKAILEKQLKESEARMGELIAAITGKSGFLGCKIEGDELILTFPEDKEEDSKNN